MVDFGDNCCFINRFKPAVNDVDHALSSWKRGVLLWNKEKASLFGDFWLIKMILHNWMLQRPFLKLKTYPPTNLYMLYPMVQSIALDCVEIEKKMPPQGGIVHCHWKSIVHSKSFLRSNFKIWFYSFKNWVMLSHLNFEFCHTLLHTSAWTVGAANNAPACEPEALPARYRRTASLSTYGTLILSNQLRVRRTYILAFANMTQWQREALHVEEILES